MLFSMSDTTNPDKTPPRPKSSADKKETAADPNETFGYDVFPARDPTQGMSYSST